MGLSGWAQGTSQDNSWGPIVKKAEEEKERKNVEESSIDSSQRFPDISIMGLELVIGHN